MKDRELEKKSSVLMYNLGLLVGTSYSKAYYVFWLQSKFASLDCMSRRELEDSAE